MAEISIPINQLNYIFYYYRDNAPTPEEDKIERDKHAKLIGQLK